MVRTPLAAEDACADIHSPDAIERILKCLDLPSRAPPAAREFPVPTRPS